MLCGVRPSLSYISQPSDTRGAVKCGVSRQQKSSYDVTWGISNTWRPASDDVSAARPCLGGRLVCDVTAVCVTGRRYVTLWIGGRELPLSRAPICRSARHNIARRRCRVASWLVGVNKRGVRPLTSAVLCVEPARGPTHPAATVPRRSALFTGVLARFFRTE